ncbi:hypothetical protein JCM10207_000155 [Rhodosporidiobolus poonsookiae]
MLPLPTSTSTPSHSRTHSRSTSPLLDDPPADLKRTLARLPAPLRTHALRLRALHAAHPLRTRFLLAFLALAALYSLFPSTGTGYTHTPLAWGTHPDLVQNWGDHVGLGLAREKARAGTPKPYSDIGDRLPRLDEQLGGPVYRKRRSRAERAAGVEKQDLSEAGRAGKKKKKTAAQVKAQESERHGTLGGTSVEWSSGIVGSGAWLGPVDMRKDAPSAPAPPPPAETSAAAAPLDALTSHIVDKGWVYLDDEDRTNTEKLQLEARAKDFLESLPLRERVRGDEEGMKSAAEGWARVYAAEAGGWPKSALEVQLEKLVRRHPVVVFSKSTCPYSRRAKERLASLNLYPPPHIVEVDLRPDFPSLKALLARRTLHRTWPNILLGSRSIGGADDLDALIDGGELAEVFEEVGVRYEGL